MRGTAVAPRFRVPGGRAGAYAKRRADAKLVSALESSVRTSTRALREVERLKRQRLVLARHVAVNGEQLKLARSIIAALEQGGNDRVGAVSSMRRIIQSRDELIAHLRNEIGGLATAAQRYKGAMEMDAEATKSQAWELAKRLRASNHEIERLTAQRGILAIHLRIALRERRIWQLMAGYDPSIAADVKALLNALRNGINCARKFVQRLFWIPIVGWRGSAEVQEALHG